MDHEAPLARPAGLLSRQKLIRGSHCGGLASGWDKRDGYVVGHPKSAGARSLQGETAVNLIDTTVSIGGCLRCSGNSLTTL